MKQWMALPSLFLSLAVWQASAEERSYNTAAKETIPDTGIGATTTGQRIILFKDHRTGLQTWQSDIFKKPEDKVIAITDHGSTVALSILNPNSNHPVLTWSFVDRSKGQIQIVISRALMSQDALHKLQINCIPVVTARNLTTHGLFRIVAEFEYVKNTKVISTASSMLGPLDKGEKHDLTTDTLYDAHCGNIRARMYIPFCKLSNGLDCKNMVVGSAFGAIPVKMGRSPLSRKAKR